MKIRTNFIIIAISITIAFILVWPNLAVRTLNVYLDPDLSPVQSEETIQNVFTYLEKNYKDRYTWKVSEEIKKKPKSEEEIEQIVSEGSGLVEQSKERFINIYGRFIQTAFINEIGRLKGVDLQRTKLSPIWSEQNLKAKPFKLGLDLQGGMNLLMEADFEKLKSQLKKQYSPDHIAQLNKKIDEEKDKDVKQGLIDDRDRVLNLLELTDEEKKGYIEGALEIIRSRVDKTGVSEPLIRLQGEDKIEISLPGVASPEQAKRIIKSTARVSYHLAEPDPTPYTNQAMQYFQEYQKLNSVKTREKYLREIERKINLSGEYGLFVLWSKIKGDVKNRLEPQYFMVLERKESLSGDHISPSTFVGFNPDSLQNTINFRLTPEGTKLFGQITSNNVGRRMAIIIDEKILSAPNINEPILTGSAQISGGFTPQEAKDLALIIKEGALPVPMNIVQESSIGPTLGKESITKGVYAILIGLIGVSIFMILYYHLAGIIANIALVLNLLFMSSILALMDFTITLPGLAGIVLTLGMAVDANVIIYERIREELNRQKSVKAAISNAFERASIAIVDSNLTTLLAAIVLSQFGIGPIKGFAITLFVGILSSLFTSLYITRNIFFFMAYGINIRKIPLGFYRKKAIQGGAL